MQNGSHGEKKKAEKVKPKIRWWKLKETSGQEAVRDEVIRILGGKETFVATDSSLHGLGAVLMQKIESKVKPIS